MRFNYLLYSYYFLFILIITKWSKSETPYTLVHGNKSLIRSFNIHDCDKDWCKIVERTNYQIEINLTLPVNVDNPKIKYTILKTKFGPPYEMLAKDYMPIFCGSLVKSYCPLKAGSNVTYRVNFQLEQLSKLSSFVTDKRDSFLFIDMFYEDSGPEPHVERPPMFSFLVKIMFYSCLLHLDC